MVERGTIRVLGVDPGTRVAGYGVLDVAPRRAPALVTAGAIRLAGDGLPERLRMLHAKLQAVIRDFRPAVLAVETIFHGKSFYSVQKVGEARGVVLLAAAQNGLDIAQFAPAVIKKSATGNGRAAKSQVQRMICRLLELDEMPQPADVTDALAIAFCYGQRIQRHELPPTVATRGARRRADGS
ncbi:MAG: crossover junction endodeoxyribonuclease RuvC [Planctomycetota bacterium]|nr:crossover junction endodeoxyribonuclease RuvC [Planctomycetota bacterium]